MFKSKLFLSFVFFSCLLSLPTYADDFVQCVVNNPSLESSASDGTPEGWKADPRLFSVTTTESHSGNACLKWQGDGKQYKLCTQNIVAKSGTAVEVSAWIKTNGIKEGYATVCLEWSKPDGTWYGGGYAHGLSDTNGEWQKVSVRTFIPQDAINPHISCYVSQGASGTAYFDDVAVANYFPPLFTGISVDCYRAQATGGIVNIFVGYNQTKADVNFADLVPQVLVLDSNNAATNIDVELQETKHDYYRFQFDSSLLPEGTYTIQCQMTDPNTSKLETISTSFQRLDRFPARASYIDSSLRLIHNGKPIFPLGLYLGGVSKEDIELIADSSFNCVMPYEAIKRETVEDLYEHKIYTIYSVKDNYPGLNVKTMEEGNALTEKTVNALKDCPGILAWYINDELPTTMVKDLASRQDQMQKLDPGRPTWTVLYQVEELRSYLPTADILGSDPYPIPSKPVSLASDWTRKTFNAGFGKRAVWQVPQIFNWASYYQGEAKKEYRAPTYEEMRNMSWQCIAEGANGLIYYSFFDLQRMAKSQEDGGRALLPEPFEERWSEVKRMAEEIANKSEILLSVAPCLDIIQTSSCSENVTHRLYGTENGTWILAVNKTTTPQIAEFEIPQGSAIVETTLGGKATLKDNVISVELDSLEPSLILVK